MPTVTARIMFVNPADPGKKYGNIKTDDPQVKRISVPMTHLYNFTKGGVYTVEYKVTDAGYYNFVSIVSAEKPQARPMVPRTGERPPAGRASASNDKFIFVTGVVGRAMGSGKFVADDIKMLTTWAADAFDRVLSPTPRLPAPPPAQAPRAPSPYNGRQGSEPAGSRDDVPYVGDEDLNDAPFDEDEDRNPPF